MSIEVHSKKMSKHHQNSCLRFKILSHHLLKN